MFYHGRLIIHILISFFSDIPVYVSTFDNNLNEHNNNQFTLMSLPNATAFGILCEKGKVQFK